MSEEFEMNGINYRLAKIDAMSQFHVLRRIMPVVSAADGGNVEMDRVMSAIGKLSDADTEYVLSKCLTDCRRQSGEAWVKIYVEGRLMFDDIGMVGMLQLALATLKGPLSDFFTGLSSLSAPAAE